MKKGMDKCSQPHYEIVHADGCRTLTNPGKDFGTSSMFPGTTARANYLAAMGKPLFNKAIQTP